MKRSSLLMLILQCTWICVEGFTLSSQRTYKYPYLSRTPHGLHNSMPKRPKPLDGRSEDTKGKNKVNAGTFNLIKAMLGSGCLALPSGLAASSDYKTTLIPAIVLLSLLGLASAYTFALYGRLVHASSSRSLGELWEKTINKHSAWLVSVASLTFCFWACLSYSLCLGDVSSSMAQSVGWHGIFSTRQFWIVLLTSLILYPLCNLRSLMALAPLSLAGVAAVLITTIFLAWRCPFVNIRSPYSIQGGQLLKTLTAQQLPKFSQYNKGLLSPSSLTLFGMAASSYLGHFTAPDLYHSLTTCSNDNVSEDGADRSSVLDDFFRVSLLGFVSTIILNCLIMGFGFITFGGNSTGVILNNFSTLDKGATICRFLTAISVIGGYPFLISACRGEILELWELKTNLKATRQHEKLITASLLLCVTGFAMIISDAGMIIGLAGAVMGSVLVYIFPSLLYLSSTKKIKQPISKRVRFERMFCEFLVVFGTFSAFAGISTIIPIGLV